MAEGGSEVEEGGSGECLTVRGQRLHEEIRSKER